MVRARAGQGEGEGGRLVVGARCREDVPYCGVDRGEDRLHHPLVGVESVVDVVLLALPQGVPGGAHALLLRVRPQLLRTQGAGQL